MVDGRSEPNLAVLLEAVDAVMLRRLHDALNEHGHAAIRPAHSVVFEQIGRDGARITDMADRAGITKQAMGYLVDHLEAHGYCERAPDPDDRRAKIVRLTKVGWEAVEVAERSLRETEQEWVERFGRTQVRTVRKVLQTILDEEQQEGVG